MNLVTNLVMNLVTNLSLNLMMSLIDYTIEHCYIVYLISVVTLFYNVNNLKVSKVFYTIICNITLILYIVEFGNNEITDTIITLMILYCVLNCYYDTMLLYSTMLYVMSYVLGNMILHINDPVFHAFLQESPYAVIISVSLGVPYVKSVAIIYDYIYEYDTQTHSHTRARGRAHAWARK